MMPSIPNQSEEALDECMLAVAVEETIAEHGGDARAAVRALLINVAFLEAARDRALDLVSRGYTRGRSIELLISDVGLRFQYLKEARIREKNA